MASESEVAFDSYNVLLVFVVLVPQSFQDFDLNLALFMQLLPILENLDSYSLFILVIKAFQNHTKCSSTQFLLYFIPILNLILCLVHIISLIIIKTKVEYAGWISFLRVLILAGELFSVVPANTFEFGVQVDVIYLIKSHYFFFFILREVLTIVPDHLFWRHWKLSCLLMHLLLLLAGELLLEGVLAAADG